MYRTLSHLGLIMLLFLLVAGSCTEPPEKTPTRPPPGTPEAYSSEPGEPKRFQGDGLEFAYEVIDGLAIYQGDIVLGTAADLEAAQAAALTALDTQSVMKDDGATCRRVNVRLCPFRGTRWPNGVLPYLIDESTYTAEELVAVRGIIARADEHFRANSGIRLVPRTSQDDYLVIKKPTDTGICGSSMLGVQGGAQSLTLQPSADLGCTVHELLHALGAAHEQSREDRGSFVDVKYDNIQANRHSQFDRAPTNVFSDHGNYDFDSIVHYPKGAFSNNRNCTAATPENCSIVPLNPAIDIERLGQRDGLSLGDREAICDIYGNPAEVFLTGLREGSSVPAGEPVNLEALYRLRMVGREPMTLRLSSSLDGEIRTFQYPQVESLTLRGLSVGEHVLTLEALRGCPDTTDTLTLNVVQTEAVLTIASPADGSSTPRRRQMVYFSASTEGFAEAPLIRWESNVDGLLGESSETISKFDLSFGEHIITATTPNPAGGTLSDSVSITITNDPPTIDIFEPAAAETFCADEMITFRATVQDLNNEGNTLPDDTVTWLIKEPSFVTLGQGKTLIKAFVVGELTVFARVVDSEGASAEDSVSLSVVDCSNTPPVATITSPAEDSGTNDDIYEYNGFDSSRGQWYTDVTLTGTGSDAEDGTLSGAALVWRTDRTDLQAAELGTGNSVTVRLYPKGGETGAWHEISLTVTDSDGESRTVIRRIYIWGVV